MMIRKMPKWVAGIALVLVAGAAPMACGGGGGTDNMGGDANDEDGTGGNDTDGTGGNDTDGTGGNDTDGSGGNGDAGSTGSGGSPPMDASIDDLISAICEWEFGCCDSGELTFRLGTAGESVAECVDFFTFQLHESNTTNNPFPPGTAQGLLGTLGYTVDLTRVTENPAGIGECVAAYEAMGCPTEVEALGYCEEPVAPGTSACSLVNLFDPALEEGDRCTDQPALVEGDGNDVECAAGTTCLPAGGDNPEDFPICVQRGESGDPCTEDDDCDYNFYCDPSGDCTEKGDEGDDCTFNDEDPAPDDEDAGCKAGLKCDPVDLVCVNNCSENYPCAVNVECPEDFVCAPVTVGSDSTSWKQCVPTGTSASDRCDEDADCAANRYCDGSVCQGDVDIGEDCTKNEECEAGSFCANNPNDEYGNPIYNYQTYMYGPTLVCTTFIQAGDPCFYPNASPTISSGCSPDAPLCLYDPTDARWECAADLRGDGDDCFDMVGQGLPSECEPGLRCETTDLTATWVYTCTAGAGAGDDCDADYTDDEDLDCGAGLTCKDAVCIEQVGPGSDCADLDDDTIADPTLCTNSACVENWDENGSEFICSDAPVPESNGGDDLTCGE